MKRIAIVEKKLSKYDWSELFPYKFDLYELSSVVKDKLTKKDITIEINIDDYDLVIAIGAEPTKYFSKTSNVITHNGFLINGKIVPLINRNMIKFKPLVKPMFDKGVKNIIDIIEDRVKDRADLNLVKIQDTATAVTCLKKLLAVCDGVLAVDTETTAFYPRKGYVLGISLSHHDNIGLYISTDAIDDECEELLQQLFNKNITVFHNAKFDLHMLMYHFGFSFPNVQDTMLMHHVLDENSEHGLKPLAIKYTDLGDYDSELSIYKKDYCKKNKVKEADFTYNLFPFDVLAEYAAIDAIATRRLYTIFRPQLEKSLKLLQVYNELVIPGMWALRFIEDCGIPFSKAALEATSREIADELFELEQEIYKVKEVRDFELSTNTKFNPNSPAQVRHVLYNVIGLTPINKLTGTGEYSTDEEVLSELADLHELPRLILKIKKHKKIKSTYIDKILNNLDSDGRLRTGFNQHITTSGRLSSSGTLNAQQLPRDDKRVKKAIQARPGFKIVSQDLKTAEVFVIAALAKDKELLDTFKRGEDFHGFIAKMENNLSCSVNEVKTLYPKLRQEAKSFSFKVLYALDLSHPVLKRFPVLKQYLIDKILEIKTYGYVFMASNRKRRLPNVFSENRKQSEHEVRSGINALVQGPSSDINLMATIKLINWITAEKLEKYILPFMLVHDSIVAEVHENYISTYCKKLAEFTQIDHFNFIPEGYKIGVDVEIGNNYAF